MVYGSAYPATLPVWRRRTGYGNITPAEWKTVESRWVSSPRHLLEWGPSSFPTPVGVLIGVVRTAREGHGSGDRLTLAARSEPTPLEEGEEAPTSSCCLTKCKDNRRVVVVTVVLAHRTDLTVGVKTHPWYVRTDRLPEPSEDS